MNDEAEMTLRAMTNDEEQAVNELCGLIHAVIESCGHDVEKNASALANVLCGVLADAGIDIDASKLLEPWMTERPGAN